MTHHAIHQATQSALPRQSAYSIFAVLALTAATLACNLPGGPTSPEGSTPPPAPLPTATPYTLAPAVPTVQPSPVATADVLPTIPVLPPLPTTVPPQVAAATPFPDEPDIVEAVLAVNPGEGEHWVAHQTAGSFSTPGADERVALVGNIGNDDEMRWVLVGQAADGWRVLGASPVLGRGFSGPPDSYLQPDLIDFDGDGRQELLAYYFSMRFGWMSASDSLYRWDGSALAQVWQATTQADNLWAGDEDVGLSYRQSYMAGWAWSDLDGDGVDEILLQGHTTYYRPGDDGYVESGTPPADETDVQMAFRWDGRAFRPYAPDGPQGRFAYVEDFAPGLWQDRIAHPLPAWGSAHDTAWSLDGQWLGWWAEVSVEGTPQAVLNLYRPDTGAVQAYALDAAPAALCWLPGGRVLVASEGQAPALIDPMDGRPELLPAGTEHTWSPNAGRLAYVRDGGIYVYDRTSRQERLIVEPPWAGESGPGAFDPQWSPRGDWIACRVGDGSRSGVALFAPDVPTPLEPSNLSFDPHETQALQFAWAPGGSRLASLALETLPSGELAAVLRVIEAPPAGSRPELIWHTLLQVTPAGPDLRLAWAPDDTRLAVAAGAEVWEVPVDGGPVLRYRSPLPPADPASAQRGPAWGALAWAPDGSGFLALALLQRAYDDDLLWFPAGGGGPVLLLSGNVDAVQWSAGR